MKGRVLVVDDDLALAEMLGIVLRNEGLETGHVADGSAISARRVASGSANGSRKTVCSCARRSANRSGSVGKVWRWSDSRETVSLSGTVAWMVSGRIGHSVWQCRHRHTAPTSSRCPIPTSAM